MAVEANWAALAAGVVGTGAVGYIVARLSKGTDARGLAEAELIGAGPKIIEQQNKRIDAMQGEITRLWGEARSAYDRERAALSRERECRDELSDANRDLRQHAQRIVVMERRLGIEEDEVNAGATILLVDDNPAWTRTMVRVVKQNLGEDARVVTNAAAALRELRTARYQLAVVDIVLDGTSGIDLAIQARRDGVRTPIVALSGASEDLNLSSDRMQQAGFSAVLSKTQRVTEIVAELRKFLPGKEGDSQ